MTALYGVHPTVMEFPAMKDHEEARLRASLERFGFLEAFPIVVWDPGDGRDPLIVDGSHRQRICAEMGIEPVYHRVTGDEADMIRRYSWSGNGARRHLTHRRIAAIYAASHPGATPKQIMDATGVGPQTARAVCRLTVDEIARVAAGETVENAPPVSPPREPATINVKHETVVKMWPAMERLRYQSVQRLISAVCQSIAGLEQRSRPVVGIALIVGGDDGETVHRVGKNS